MMNPLFVIEKPQTYSYREFLSFAVSQIPAHSSCVDVLVTSLIENTAQLTFILSSLYTQIRGKLLEREFSYDFEINVYINKHPNGVFSHSMVFHVEGESLPEFLSKLNTIAVQICPPSIIQAEDVSSSADFGSIETVAVGGTFDHLHDGHKILLSSAAFAARTNIIIGVTGEDLLKNKKYPSQLQNIEFRMRNTCAFLRKVLQPGQRFQLYKINDVCGPTGFLPNINALVISEETLQGATYVNSHREEMGLSRLAVLCAKVIGGDDTGSVTWAGKLSSTELRKLEREKFKKLK